MPQPPTRVVVLTGAGISAESGIQTFRGGGGLWEGHRVEDVASPEGFRRDPERVQRFYNQRRRDLQQAEVRPNAAHLALAAFEARFQGEFLLITQNVDDLHDRAGSRNLLHMHGELLKARCVRTGEVFDWRGDLGPDTPHPTRPDLRGTLRPHIVWFGEMPLYLDPIQRALSRADLFVSIGTSGNVYPAAGFVAATHTWCRKVEINLGDTEIADDFDERLVGPATEVVPAFFNTL